MLSCILQVHSNKNPYGDIIYNKLCISLVETQYQEKQCEEEKALE